MTEAQDERYGRLTNKRENESVHFWHLSIPVPMPFSFFVARLSSEQKSEGSGFSRNELHPEENKSENVLA